MNHITKINKPISALIVILLLLVIACQSSSNKIQSENTAKAIEKRYNDTSHQRILFLWRKMQFDSSLNDTISRIELNTQYCKTMPDEVKAAVGYIATFIGNECTWDGTYTANRSNLKCRIFTALNLGYQCSPKHLGFLRKMFANDSAVLAELAMGNCPTIPEGASVETTFNSMVIYLNQNEIKLDYTLSWVNMREAESLDWRESARFKINQGKVFLMEKHKSKMNNIPLILKE